MNRSLPLLPAWLLSWDQLAAHPQKEQLVWEWEWAISSPTSSLLVLSLPAKTGAGEWSWLPLLQPLLSIIVLQTVFPSPVNGVSPNSHLERDNSAAKTTLPPIGGIRSLPVHFSHQTTQSIPPFPSYVPEAYTALIVGVELPLTVTSLAFPGFPVYLGNSI